MAQESVGTRPDGPPLLASRLVAPAPPEPLVLRPRLLRRLDEGSAGPVTLVRAPAGWGKTTLLASWARAAGSDRAPAWLSVEVGDTGDRLWAYLSAALGPPGDGPDASVPPGAGPDQLERLAAALADRDRPVVLVLDDLHRITEPAALDGLEFLLRHGGQRLRLVIGARTDPALPLHRWRLRGELTPVDADDLAFTTDEVADLLTAHGVAVPPAAVSSLRGRTGGWPAGLRFAALAARAATDPAHLVAGYTGDQPDMADYLRDEVLAELTHDHVDVLRRTAVGETVCGALADAVTGRSDGDGVLADLARCGGLVQPDDGRSGWYRCHPLLADLLRADLARLPAGQVRELHRRAAGWHAGNGRPAAALRHALAAGDWDRATGLVLTRWPELVPYDPEPAGPPPAGPPADLVARDPELALALAVERATAADRVAALGHLRHAVAEARDLPAPRRDRFRTVGTALEIALARLAGDHAEVRAAAARLRRPPVDTPAVRDDDLHLARAAGGVPDGGSDTRATFGPTPKVLPGDDPRSGAADRADILLVAGTAEALTDLAEGHLHRAGTRLPALAEAARTAGRPGTGLVCRSRAALVAAWWGRLREAEQAAGETLAGAATSGDRGYAYLALALVALYRGRPGEAEAYLGRADVPGPVPAAVTAYCRAHLLCERGDVAAAHRVLTRARDDATGGREVTDRLLTAEADLAATRGDLTTARDLLTGPTATRDLPGVAGGPSDRVAPELAVALARVELRAGDPRAAAAALPGWDTPEAGRWPLAVRLDAGLLDVLLARQGGDPRRAGRLLERVLELAEPEGHRRVFTRAEPGVRDLLAEHLDSGTAYWPFIAELRHDSDPAAGGGAPARPRPADDPGRGLDEPLTERELTILRYLQSILSNVEIASELSLSVNTVKTHVRNIYRKLDATRRREAVRRARELHLI